MAFLRIRRGALLAVLALVASSAAADCGESLASELLQRLARDQAARDALQADPASKPALATAIETDADNTAFMRGVLARCGWPKRSAVGEAAARAAWVLTQHADMDPDYQIAAARQLERGVLAGEAEPIRLALLVDRQRRLADQPQVYGMQHYRDGDMLRFFDIVTPGRLDARRREIGLPPFYCWAHELSRTNPGAALDWPQGVPFRPEPCPDGP